MEFIYFFFFLTIAFYIFLPIVVQYCTFSLTFCPLLFISHTVSIFLWIVLFLLLKFHVLISRVISRWKFSFSVLCTLLFYWYNGIPSFIIVRCFLFWHSRIAVYIDGISFLPSLHASRWTFSFLEMIEFSSLLEFLIESFLLENSFFACCLV